MPKKFFKFFRFQLNKSHLPFPIWCGKRDNYFSRRNGKGVRLMKPSDFQKTVQCRFESCLKKVVRHVVKDYQKKLKRRQKEETLFCELPEIVVENLAVWDDYDTDYTIFNVCGNDIRVYDDELAEALKQLSERNRDAASIRSTQHIIQCIEAGADVATCPLAAIKGLLKHPLTDSGLATFLADYKKVNG